MSQPEFCKLRLRAAWPIVLLAAIALVSAGQQTKPPTRSGVGAARGVPSYKDLHFPNLREIELPHIETYTLPNGMKLMLLEDHELPLVTGRAMIRTGNLLDPPQKIGLAGITGEVMRTGGTTSKTGEQLDDELEAIAASVETGIDETFGWAGFSCLKENTDQVLADFADVLMHPAFRPDKIELAKVEERGNIERRNDEASEVASYQFHDLVYGKQTPYGWETQYATIDAIGRGDLVNLYQRYFHPNVTLLAVWGDFSSAEMRAKLEHAFSAWPSVEVEALRFPAVARADYSPSIYFVNRDDVNQTNIRLGHLGGEFRDKDYPALAVMSDILGGGFASRLFQNVRTRLGLAYSVGANWGAEYDHPGLFRVGASTKSASTVEALQAILDQVDKITAAEVTDQELQTAKDSVLNSFIFAFDTRSKLINRLMRYTYYGYPEDFIFQYRAGVERVTKADVLRVARESINPRQFAIVVVGNEKEFGKPLASLGKPVQALDVSIPPERAAARPAGAAAQR